MAGGEHLPRGFLELHHRIHPTAVIYAYKHSGSEPGYADDLVLVDEGPQIVSVWSDEFDGEGALDGSKWTYESGFVRNEGCSGTSPRTPSKKTGAELRAFRDPPESQLCIGSPTGEPAARPSPTPPPA